MNAAITGASGFFGGALTRALCARGDCVRTLVRRPAAAAELESVGATTILGELTRPDGCDGFVQRGDIVFHAAARVDMSGRWEKFQQTTIEGTRHLLAAALPAKPQRFVYISSGGVYSTDGKDKSCSADRTPARPSSYNFYGRAKLAAENLVRAECDRAGCEWTILRLGFLYGEGNKALYRHIVPLARTNRFWIIGPGCNRIATLYIDDAVRATILAGEAAIAAGKIYDLASDEPVTQKEFFEATADALDLPRPTRHADRWMAIVAGWLTDRISQWYGHESHVTRAGVALVSANQVVDSSRIREELGWRPEISFAEGMRRMREWYLIAAQELANTEFRNSKSNQPSPTDPTVARTGSN